MKKKSLNVIVGYAVSALALLVVLSTVLVSFVFAKYANERKQSMNVRVFAYGGDIDLALCEGAEDTPWEDAEHRFLLRPGTAYVFDPYVHLTVTDNDRDCYLFVKIELTGGEVTVDGVAYTAEDFVSYTAEDDWTQGDGEQIPSNVYYMRVAGNVRDEYFPIMDKDRVLIPYETPERAFEALTEENLPEIVITAYAIELTELEDATSVENTTPEGAWAWMMANVTPVPVDTETN